MATNPEQSRVDEALKACLGEGDAKRFQDTFEKRREEIKTLHPTEQTYLEAWNNIITVRENRNIKDEPLIWETEKNKAVLFLTDLQSFPTPVKEAESIRQNTLGTSAAQKLEASIIEAWEEKAAPITPAAEAAKVAAAKKKEVEKPRAYKPPSPHPDQSSDKT